MTEPENTEPENTEPETTEPENLPRERGSAEACPVCGDKLVVAETREDGSEVLEPHDHPEAQESETAEQAPEEVPREQGTEVPDAPDAA